MLLVFFALCQVNPTTSPTVVEEVEHFVRLPVVSPATVLPFVALSGMSMQLDLPVVGQSWLLRLRGATQFWHLKHQAPYGASLFFHLAGLSQHLRECNKYSIQNNFHHCCCKVRPRYNDVMLHFDSHFSIPFFLQLFFIIFCLRTFKPNFPPTVQRIRKKNDP